MRSNFVVRARAERKKRDVRLPFVGLPDERVNFGDGLGDSAVDQLAGGGGGRSHPIEGESARRT